MSAPFSSGDEHVEALERRVEELQTTISSLRDDLSALRRAATYTYGALVELYVDTDKGANSEKYSAALDKISGALDKIFERSK